MKFITTFFSMLIIGITMSLSAQNAPIATLGTVNSTASTVVVPINANNFNSIRSCDLVLHYNSAVATPTNITIGPGMGGAIDFYLGTPGEIRLGWYSSSGVTLTNGSAIFNITFNKVSFGTSILSFDVENDDYDCQFYNASNQALNDSPASTYYITGSLTFSPENASPVTTAPALTACVGTNINVPVTVSGFSNIGAVSLTLKYDPLVLSFNSGINTGGFPGLLIGNPIPGTIVVGGNTANPAGYSIVNGSAIFTLNFTYLGGSTALSWFDNRESCEYAGSFPNFNVLNDIPQATYYINGSVGPCEVTPTPTIVVGAITDPVTCGGNGTIPLTFTNVPDGIYTINYDGGSFPNIDVLANAASISAPAGTYNNLQITVSGITSALGVNAILTDPAKPTAIITPDSGVLTCTVSSIILDASGSAGAVSYLWTGGSTGSTLSVTAPGDYTVTVTAANGCTDTETVTITQDEGKPTAIITPASGVLTCTVSSIILDASGSAGVVSYLWTGGSTGSTLSVTAPGDYTVTVTAANGCTDTETVTITQDEGKPTAIITPDSGVLTCTVTSIILDASGSAGAVSYLWTGGSTGSTLSVTAPGDYTVTVTAANGCTDTETVTITQDEGKPTAIITPASGVLTCTVSSIILDASGSAGVVSYLWTGGSTGSTLSVTAPGDYTVTVTSANGCTDTETVTITQDEGKPTASITPDSGVLTCTVTSIVLDASGSAGAVSYLWTGGSTGSTLSVTAPGDYTVTVTAANGCTDTETVTITQDEGKPTAIITPDSGVLTCTVTSIVLDASGSTGAVSYLWTGGSTGSTLSVTAPGDYTVTVTAANGCTDTETVTITQDEGKPTAIITPDSGVLTCTVTSIILDASGSAGAVSYLWTGGSTGSTLSVTAPGDYTVTVTAANGCTDTETVTITQDEGKPTAIITPASGVLTCTVSSIILDASGSAGVVSYLWTGGSTGSTLSVTAPGDYTVTVTAANGCTDTETVTITQDEGKPTAIITPASGVLTCTVTSITLDASGSTGAVSYLWTGGSTGSTLSVTAPGDYTVTVTAANGCTDTETVTITQDEGKPTAIITPDSGVLTCTVTSITLDASGSAGAVSYLWTGGSTGSTLSVSAPGDYTVTVTAANGCTDKKTVTITQDEGKPTAIITPDSGVLTCTVSSIILDASGSAGAVSYLWTGGSTGSTLSVTAPGDYTVTVTAANGCTDKKTVTITQDEGKPTAIITPDSGVLTCTVSSIILDASGSAGVVSYLWTGGYTGSTLSVTAPGDYTVTVTAANGCTDTETVTITQDEGKPTAIITPDSGVLTCTVTSIILDASGSAGAVSYLWTGGSTGSTLSVTAPGDYTVTVTAANGCTASASITITLSENSSLPVGVSIVASVNPVNVGTEVFFTATPTNEGTSPDYQWKVNGVDEGINNPVYSYIPEQGDVVTCVLTSSETCATNNPATSNEVIMLVISQGTTQLSYRFANPRISNGSGSDNFEFDVQVKADIEGTTFRNGNVNLIFDPATLSSSAANWTASAVSDYGTSISISGSTLNIELNAGTIGTEITADYQTLVTVRALITDENGVAGIDFNEANMNGQQFYKLASSPWYAAYANPNGYDPADFVDTYVGRIYATIPGWTQSGGLVDWNNAVNTSVWEGNASIPGGSLANASNLRIHIPATLLVPVNGQMTVTVDTEIKTLNGLTLESNDLGTGSFISGSASGAGSATAQRYMTTDAWHIVSSPLSGQSIAGFLASNANVATDVDDEAIRGMMDYNPEFNVWNNYFINSTTGNLGTGQGFCMRTNAASAVTFAGMLQAGFQPASGLVPEKWNCIGNPYTSAIGINQYSSSTSKFLNENVANLDPSYGAIYVWDNLDENNGLWGKYTIISNTNTGVAFDVQQGQAFMVKMNTAETIVSFNSGMQIHEPSLALKSTGNIWPTIKLKASVNSQVASTIIAFNNGMTKGLDRTYDAGLLKGGADLAVYSSLVEDNGISFAIQALPENQYSGMIIPIGLDFNTGGEVVFSSDLINLPADCQVILEDKWSKTFTDLSKNVYQTAVDANSSIHDRFQIHTSFLTTGLDPDFLSSKLSAYAIQNVEIRVNGQVSSQAIATLYDLQGRMILVKNMEEGSSNTIRIPNIKTAIYMLFVKDRGKSQGFKIYVKE